VFLADPVAFGLNRLFLSGLRAVRLLENRPEISFSVFAAAPNRFNVIEVPSITGHDLPAGELTDPAVFLEYAKTDPRRDGLIVVFCNPFINATHCAEPCRA
jgi:hypothetical protein